MTMSRRVRAMFRRTVQSMVLLAGLMLPVAVQAQQQVVTQSEQTITVERGKTALLRLSYIPRAISVGDSTIADLRGTNSPQEYLINGLTVGSTTIIIWDQNNVAHLMNAAVVIDATALQTQLNTLFPGAGVTVTPSGDAVIISGTVRDAAVARRVLELAGQSGARVIDALQGASPEQILLQVRIAEVRRQAGSRMATDLFASNVGELDEVFGEGSTATIETLSDGIMRLFLIGRTAQLDAIIRALRERGEFRSLAEPNLVTLAGQEASFLAGGEFPYPSVQSGAQTGAITVIFKEFGVRLRFTPTVTPTGSIRLQVEPEVSSLDFANGLTIQGFQIPSLLTRRASSQVELADGQHLAIAGLLDNSITEDVDKLPLLGDIPIIGTFFRNKSDRQSRTELLVIVTPHVVQPTDLPIPIPTGEPGTWRWKGWMRPDTTHVTRHPGGR